MSLKMRIAAALGIGASVLVVLLTLALRGGPPPPPADSPARQGPRVVWPEGTRYTYSVSWLARTRAPGDAKRPIVSTESAIDGEIALERAAGTPTRMLVALSWTRVDRF